MNPILLQAVADPNLVTVGTKEISLWELIAGPGGQSLYVMIPIMIMSVVAVYIIVERYLVVKRAKKFDESFVLKLKDYLNDGKIDAAKSLCDSNNTPVGRMLGKGISRIGHPIDDINSAMENKAKLEMFDLEKNLSLLATLAGAGPLMGLIGTVVGMIITFYSISVSGEGVKIDVLAGGVYQAMIATVGGLIVGIIAYVGYNLFVAKVQKIVHQMETSGVELVEILQQKVK